MMKHQQVIQAWIAGRPAEGNSMSTDGRNLFSYSLPIARYSWSDDRPVVFDYTAGSGNFVSVTTSKQINQTIRWLAEEGKTAHVIHPEVEGLI